MKQNVKKWIEEIEAHKREFEKLKQREELLLAPMLCDTAHMTPIREWVEALCGDEENVTNQYLPVHYFLVIVVLLYSPRVLMGDFMYRGSRTAIAKELNLSPSHISNSIRTVCEWYKIYTPFQNSVDYLYNEVVARMMEHEII